MWFRRRRRPPPLDLSSLERSLDRLSELVERIVALIPELVGARSVIPIPPAVEPSPAPAPEPASEPAPEPASEPAPEPQPEGFVLFVGSPNGYRLLERDGVPPSRGVELELEDERYVVLRQGPSPLPGDGRRCVFLERQENGANPRR